MSEAIFFFFLFCGILFGRWKNIMVEYNFAVGNLNVEFSFCCSTIYNKHLIKITKSWFWQDSRKFDFAEGRFWKILREFNIRDFSKNYNIREIFFPRNFTPLRFDHSPVSKRTIKKKKEKEKKVLLNFKLVIFPYQCWFKWRIYIHNSADDEISISAWYCSNHQLKMLLV